MVDVAVEDGTVALEMAELERPVDEGDGAVPVSV